MWADTRRRRRVRVDPTVVVGAVLFSGFALRPGAWIAFALVATAHVLGHATAAHALGLPVVGLVVHGAGGEAALAGRPSVRARAAVAWGGVIGQVVLGGIAWVASARLGAVGGFSGDLLEALVRQNAMLAAFNLLPFPPFDGVDAWRGLTRVFGRRAPMRAPPRRPARLRMAESRAEIVAAAPKPSPSAQRDVEIERYAELLLRRHKRPKDRSRMN
jgi:hypothetical protein